MIFSYIFGRDDEMLLELALQNGLYFLGIGVILHF